MYTEGVFHLSIIDDTTPLSFTSAAVIKQVLVLEGMQIRKIMAHVTTSPTVTATVITVRKRSARGITSGQVTIGTITIPVGATIGNIYYKDLDSVKYEPGNELVFEVTTTSTAGAGFVACSAYQSNQDYSNVAVAIASA